MNNRFKDFGEDVRELVLSFEEMIHRGESHYFDVDQMEIIIDFYLETLDVDHLEQAVVFAERLFPTSNSIRLRRSHLLCSKERYDEAFVILQELEQQEPNNTDVMYALGAIHSIRNNPKQSIDYYLKASRDGYELGMVYGNVADEYMRLGKGLEAMDYYKKALKENPDEVRSIHNLFDCYEWLQREDEGVDFFKSFIEEHPYSDEAWFSLGMCCRNLSLWENAIEAFEFVSTINEKRYDGYSFRADCYCRMGDKQKAVAVLHDCIPHVEDKYSVYGLIGSYYMDMENYATAIIYFKKAIDEYSEEANVWMAIAICYAYQNDPYASKDYLHHAFEVDPNATFLYSDAARICAMLGDQEEAIDFFEKGIDAGIEDRRWTDYADYLIDWGRFDEAIEVLQRGVVECDFSFAFNERLAICYFLTNRRNYLFNALQACVQENKNQAQELLSMCPAMANDLEVVNILQSN